MMMMMREKEGEGKRTRKKEEDSAVVCHYPRIKPDRFCNVEEFTEEMSEYDVRRLREEVQDYLATKQITTVEELAGFMIKRRNAAVIPMKKNTNGSCCRVENPGRLPHDLTITLDCSGAGVGPPSLVMLYRPEASRASICWKKRDDGGYCNGKPGLTADLSCGAHPPNPKISYIPLAPNASCSDEKPAEDEGQSKAMKKGGRKGQWERVAKQSNKKILPIDESKKPKPTYASSLPRADLVGCMGPGCFGSLQKGLIQIAFSSAIKAALEHYGKKSGHDVADTSIPVCQHIQIPYLKRFLGERIWTHRYISLSYEPHRDRFLVRSGDDGDWEMICKEESCLNIAEGVRGPHCKSHHTRITKDGFEKGLQAAVLGVICRAAGAPNSTELMRNQESLVRLSRRLAENEERKTKLNGVFGDWSFSIYLSSNGAGCGQVLAVDKVRKLAADSKESNKPIRLQLCQEEACLELYSRDDDVCPRCSPTSNYVVCVFKSGDEYYIGAAAGSSDLQNIRTFRKTTVHGKEMKADSSWSHIKTIEGYYTEDEANSLVIAAHLALLIESQVFNKVVKLVRMKVKLGPLVYHFLQWLLGKAGLRLVLRGQMAAELLPCNDWMSYEIRSEREDGEGIIYECYSEILNKVYVGKTSGEGTGIAAYHYEGTREDASNMKLLSKVGKTKDRIVASIDGKTELSKSSALYNEHLEKVETVVMLSRSIASGGPFKNKNCKGIVNALTSDFRTDNPKEFLYQLFNTLLQHYGESLSWESDGTKIKPYFLS